MKHQSTMSFDLFNNLHTHLTIIIFAHKKIYKKFIKYYQQ